jgi:hypothetical protein
LLLAARAGWTDRAERHQSQIGTLLSLVSFLTIIS